MKSFCRFLIMHQKNLDFNLPRRSGGQRGSGDIRIEGLLVKERSADTISYKIRNFLIERLNLN